MAGVPSRLLKDTVSVQTFAGTAAYGPSYEDPATVYCKLNPTRQLVRGADGEEAVSELTLFCHPDDASKFAPGSLVTVSERTSVVLTMATANRPGENVVTEVNCS